MHDETIETYIEYVYDVLSPEEIFSRAKEYSWQTFYHHSVSVATIAYRLAELVKKNIRDAIQRKAIENIERELGIEFEKLVFLIGLTHDYTKLYRSDEPGEEKIKRVLGELLKKWFISPELQKKIVSKAILCAQAVEGKYVPDLEESYTRYAVTIARVADILMSLGSVNEAVSQIHTDKDIKHLINDYSLQLGFVRVSTPSILYAKVSDKIVDLLRKHGWVPLVLYADGIIAASTEGSVRVRFNEIEKAIENEIANLLGLRELERVLGACEGKKRTGLCGRALRELFGLLKQSGGKMTLGQGSEEAKEIYVYHDLMVRYLAGASISDLEKEFRGLKEKIGGKKRKPLIDPRTLATGWEGGSKYFDEVLGSIVVSSNAVIRFVESLDEEKRFLMLSYMVAFASKDVSPTVEILRKALNIDLPKTLDDELIRIIAIAEVYRSISDINRVDRLIETCFEVLADKVMKLQFYVERFVAISLKSDIIDAEQLESRDFLQKTMAEAKNYCRICGAPVDKSGIPFASYGHAIGGVGGASEIWLHDDPPLADLERIATDKNHRIRFICPLCFFEAIQIREGYKPPFIAVTFHPAIAYDMWEYLRIRVASIAGLYSIAKSRASDVAEIYKEVLEKGMKVSVEFLRNQTQIYRIKAPNILIDSLGARILIPLGEDMSLKRKYVAVALALMPIPLSVAGGGQVGLVNTIGDAYNLGTGVAPVVVPHQSNLILSILRVFEEAPKRNGKQGKTLDVYVAFNQSYIALLEVLYLYGLKLFSLYSIMRRARRDVKLEDYALKLHEFIASIPFVTLALDAPPPVRLDPREGDEELPYSSFISSKVIEVENRMSQVSKLADKEEEPSLSKLIYRYAVNLRELVSILKLKPDLKRYGVQKPLRRGIEVLLQYASTINEKDAKDLAVTHFLEQLSSTLNTSLDAVTKKIKNERGEEAEVSYDRIFHNIFDELADLLLKYRKEMNPTQFRNLIEILLDAAYYKYRHIR